MSLRQIRSTLTCLMFFTLSVPLHAQVHAAFTVDVDSGAAPLSVQFFDQSTPSDSVIWRGWDLDDDGIADSQEKNPFFTYETPGRKSVTLVVQDSSGYDTARYVDFVEVAPVEETDIAVSIHVVEKNTPIVKFVELWGYAGSASPTPQSPVSLRMPVDTNGIANFYKGKFLNVLSQNMTDLLLLDADMHVLGKIGFWYPLKDFIRGRRKDAYVILHRDLVSYQDHPRETSASSQWVFPRYLRFPWQYGADLHTLAMSGDAVQYPLYQTTMLLPPLSADSGAAGAEQFRTDNIRHDRVPFVLLHGRGRTDPAWGADEDIIFPSDTLDADFNGKRDYAYTSYPARLQRRDHNHADRFDVWQYCYPPDQNWEESGFLFARDLELLLSMYDTTVATAAAQGMGGLVLRSYLEGTARNWTYFQAETAPVSFRNDIYKVVFLGTPHAGQLRAGLAYAAPEEMQFPNIMDRYAPALRELMPGRDALQRLSPSSFPAGVEALNIAGSAPAVNPPLPVESALHDDGSTALSSAMLPAARTANGILAGMASEALQTPDDATGRLAAPDPDLLPGLLYGFTLSDSTLADQIGEFLVYNAPDTLRFSSALYQPPFALSLHTDVGIPSVTLQLHSGGNWPVNGTMRLRLDVSAGNRLFAEDLSHYEALSDAGLFLYPSTMYFGSDPVTQQAGTGATTFIPVSRAGAEHPFRGGALTLSGYGWQLPVQQQSILPDPVLSRMDNLGRRFDLARPAGDIVMLWSRERRNTLQISTHESMLLDTRHPLQALEPDAISSLLEIETDCMTQALSVIIDYSGSTGDPGIALLAPDASMVTPAMANDTSVFATESAALKMKALTVIAPQSGSWLLLIDGVAMLPQGVRAAVEHDNMQNLHIRLQPRDALSRESAVVSVALEGGPALTQQNATLVLVDSADTRTPLPLRDDGTAPDTLADDGVFTAGLTLPRAGTYHFEAYYDAQSSSCAIRRDAMLPLPLAPSLELLSPLGGEVRQSGTVLPVRWQGERPTEIFIDLSTDSGASWSQIAGPLAVDAGAWQWTLPALTSTHCRVRVRAAGNPALTDESPEDFTIYEQPVVQVVAPDGGEEWRVDTEHRIRWESIGVSALDLAYSTDNGNTWLPIESGVQAAMREYAWRVPLTPSDHCLLRAASHDDPSIFDRSATTFRITPIPAVEVISPNGGEQWQIRTVQRIRWQSAGIDSVRLLFSDSLGTAWEEIGRTTAVVAEYDWSVPDRISDLCMLRIEALDVPGISDESDGAFSITPEPYLNLVKPDGGERWEIGTTKLILWESAGISSIDIEYSTDNGAFWKTVAVNIEGGLHRYSWIVPVEPSEHCRIRVRDTYDSTRVDVSAQPFAISESLTRPTLYAPTDASEGVSTIPRFRWIPFAGAVSYRLQVTSDPAMSFWTLDEQVVGVSSFQSPELDRNTRYYWRVKAMRADATESEWSVVWSFRTSGSTLAAPVHEAPPDGALGQFETTSLSWYAAENASGYQLQVARDEQFTDLVLNESGLTGLSYTVAGLSHEDDYWWRLRSGNTGSAAYSDWSRPWKFSTAPPPPRQLTPFDGLPDIPVNALLQWYPTDGARAYHLQVAIDNSFANIVFDSTNIRGTAVYVRNLKSYTFYWWRLNVTTGRGTSDYNTPWRFRTIDLGTGIDMLPDEQGFHIIGLWPQPARGGLVHVMLHSENNAKVIPALYDMLGRLRKTFPAEHVETGTALLQLNYGQLPPGSYILRLVSGTWQKQELLHLQ
ncbi:hypothetical protein KQI65_03510 [bacterium]|nr:hypothetical protein [bacterium]